MKLNRIAAAVALMAPAVAIADPITATALILQTAVASQLIVTAFIIGANVVKGAKTRRDAKKRAASARAAYNASLQDRTILAPRADAPWQIVYGRAVVSGFPADIFATDKTGVLQDTTTYNKADGFKHVVLELAHHPCEAIHEVYIEGVALGPLNADGFPTGGDYGGTRTDIRQVNFTGTTTLPEPATSIFAAYTFSADFDRQDVTVSITGGGLTLNGPPGVPVTVEYFVTAIIRSVRVQKMLGAFDQPVNAYLNTLAPSRYTANHRFRGITYLVITFDLEDPRWQGGLPNITADVSGARLYDPRKDSTVPGGSGSHRANNPATWEWSQNPALCVRDFLTAVYGMDTEDSDVDVQTVIAAANACDEAITLQVTGSADLTNVPRYTCNGSFTTEQAKEAVLADLAECMAGTVTDGAGWSVQAGVWTAPVMTLTDDDLAGLVEVVQSDTPVDELFNGVRGKQLVAGAQAPSDINPYSNATFVTADGAELWTDVELPFTNHVARARNLARIAVERNRAGQVLRYPAKFRAWVLRIGDRVTLTHAPYGITALTYRVTDWQWSPGQPVLLTLQRDAASIWDLADAATPNPTPSTDLPNPWAVPAVTGVVATSGNATLLRTFDGSVVPRVKVTWDAITDPFVLDNGRVEIVWRRNEDLTPNVIQAQPEERAAYILGAAEFDRLVIEVRARNNRNSRGNSTFVAHTVIGKSAPPANVSGFTGSVNKGRILWAWNSATDVDYGATEVRATDANWGSDSVQPLFRGRANQWAEIVTTTGTRTRFARHLDESGNPSAASVTASVTVNAGDLVQDGAPGSPGAPAQLLTLLATAQAFSFDTLGGAQPAGQVITFTAQLANLSGTATFTCERFSVSGASLGTLTLGGTGNSRTLAIADFGTAHYAVVTATLAGLSDQITVNRVVSGAPTTGVVNPGYIEVRDDQVSTEVARAGFQVRRDGSMRVENGIGGWTAFNPWFVGGSSTVGDDYDVRYDVISSVGDLVYSAGAGPNGWMRIDQDRSIAVQWSIPGVASEAHINFFFRRRSDGVTLVFNSAYVWARSGS